MTAPTYAVRVGTPSDASILRDLRCEALLESPSAYGARYSDIATQPLAYWEKLLRQRHYFLACSTNEAVGMACVDRFEFDHYVGLGVFSMYVRAASRGSRVAADLIDACKAYARSRGANSLYLDVVDGNDRALAFYLREGFVPVGELRPMAKDESRTMRAMVSAL